MIHIAVLNQSTRVTADQLEKMTAAIQIQTAVQVAPAWDRMPPEVKAYPNAPAAPFGACVLCLKDTISDQNALGYHTEGADGSYWGDIAVNPILDNGGGVLDGGSSGYSVASVLSHEVIELLCDPTVNAWTDGPTIPEGSCYALEACDPVEGTLSMIHLPDGTDVALSNWVTPKWFDVMAPRGSLFDWEHQLSKPFTLARGGYCVVRKGPGTETDIFAAQLPPFWRLASKAANPTNRRSKRKLRRIDPTPPQKETDFDTSDEQGLP